MNVPDHLMHPLDRFADDFRKTYDAGVSVFADSSVAIVGLARNCAPHLQANLSRLKQLVSGCSEWQLHVETNDNTDHTEQVLIDFCAANPQATFTSKRLDRKQYTAEFAGPRTRALAEYRTACQNWVREHARYVDLVVVLDFDAWGGWSHAGFMSGVGALHATPGAAGMASVSLIQYPMLSMDDDQKAKVVNGWVHYDCWALRLNSAWDDYTAGAGAWKHTWLPPVGSPPIPVVSAFGGLAIYETHAYLAGVYSGEDCEHVTFHESIAKKTHLRMYLNPSMRMVMHWMTEPSDGGRNSND